MCMDCWGEFGHWSQNGRTTVNLNPGCRLTVLPVNVTDTDSLERAVQAIADMPNVSWPLDMVVMNAGVGQLLPALETDAATTEQIVRCRLLCGP